MANELPQYKASNEIRPAPVVNAGEPFQKLAGLLDTFSNKRIQEAQVTANMKAADQGEAAGFDMNFKPATGSSQVDIAYNQAGKKANRLLVGADVSANIQRIQADILSNPNFNPQTAQKEFASAVQGYAEGTLPNISETSRPFAQNMIKYHAMQADSAIQKHIAAGTSAMVSADIMMTTYQFHMDSMNAANQGNHDAAMALSGQARQAVLLGVQTGKISPAYAASYMKNMKEDIVEQTYLGQFSRAVDTGKTAEFLESFDKHSHSDLDPLKVQTIRSKMNGILQAKQQTENLTNVSLNVQAADNVTRAGQGLPLNQEAEQKLAALAPTAYKDHQLNIQQAQKSFADTQSLYNVPIDKRADVMQNLKPDFAKPGASKALVNYANIAKVNAQQMQLMQKDPGAYTVSPNNPIYKSIFTQYQTTKDFNEYNTNILAYQSSMGIPSDKQRLLPNDKAAGLVSQITNADYLTGLNQLKSLQMQYGKNMTNVMKSLTEQKLPKTYNMLMGMQDIPKSAAAVPDAIQAFNLAEGKIPGGKGNELDTLFKTSGGDPKTITANVSSKMHDWLATTNAYSSMSGEAQSEYISGVTNLAKFYVSKGVDEKAAIQKSYDALIGNKYEQIEGTYRIPHGLNPSMVKTAMTLKDQSLKGFDAQTLKTANPYLSEKYLGERNLKDAIQAGHWVSMPDDSGWMRVDVNGLQVKDKTGKPFAITIDELMSPVSVENFNKLDAEASKLDKENAMLTARNLR